MAQTTTGQNVILDVEKMGPDPEKSLRLVTWGSSTFYLAFIFVPLFMLVDKLGKDALFPYLGAACLAIFIACVIVMRPLAKKRHPSLPHKGALFMMHYRLLFFSTAICLLYADVGTITYSIVGALWIFSEYRHISSLRGVPDEALFSAYSVRFTEQENGDFLYNPREKVNNVIKPSWIENFKVEAVMIPIVVIVGGYLYFKSFALRGNFEARMLIVAAIMFVLAVGIRPFITRSALDLRAVKLKLNGKY